MDEIDEDEANDIAVVSTPWDPFHVGQRIFERYQAHCNGTEPKYVLSSGVVQALVGQVDNIPCVYIFGGKTTPQKYLRAMVDTLCEIGYQQGVPSMIVKSRYNISEFLGYQQIGGPSSQEYILPSPRHLSPLGVIFETTTKELVELAYAVYLRRRLTFLRACGVIVSHTLLRNTNGTEFVTIQTDLPTAHHNCDQVYAVLNAFLKEAIKVPTITPFLRERVVDTIADIHISLSQGVQDNTSQPLRLCTPAIERLIVTVTVETVSGQASDPIVNAAVRNLLRVLVPMSAVSAEPSFLTDVVVYETLPDIHKRVEIKQPDGTSEWEVESIFPSFPCVVLDVATRDPYLEKVYMESHPLLRFERPGQLTRAVAAHLGPDFSVGAAVGLKDVFARSLTGSAPVHPMVQRTSPPRPVADLEDIPSPLKRAKPE